MVRYVLSDQACKVFCDILLTARVKPIFLELITKCAPNIDFGNWIAVELPVNYPYKSPSIGFTNRIYHPNVDEV